MSRRVTVTLLILFGWLSVASAQDLSADEVMRRLREKFEEAGGFSATFEQTLESDFSESASSIRGTIIVSGDKYRIETPGQTIVTDGVTTWVFVPADQQVIVNNFVEDEGSFSPGQFLHDRIDEYEIAFADTTSPGNYVVRLQATSPDNYLESATLWIDRTAFTVSRIDVVDVNGASIRFEMSDIKLSPEVTDETFTFEPAEGVEVVDLR